MGIQKTEVLFYIHPLAVHNRTVLWIGKGKLVFGKGPFIGPIIIKLRGFQLFAVVALYDHMALQIHNAGSRIIDAAIRLYGGLLILLIEYLNEQTFRIGLMGEHEIIKIISEGPGHDRQDFGASRIFRGQFLLCLRIGGRKVFGHTLRKDLLLGFITYPFIIVRTAQKKHCHGNDHGNALKCIYCFLYHFTNWVR